MNIDDLLKKEQSKLNQLIADNSPYDEILKQSQLVDELINKIMNIKEKD